MIIENINNNNNSNNTSNPNNNNGSTTIYLSPVVSEYDLSIKKRTEGFFRRSASDCEEHGLMKKKSRSETESTITVAFAVTFYIVTSIVMVLVNKAVLSSSGLPITFLWIQLIVAVFLLRVLAAAGMVRLPLVDVKTCKSMLPLISINVLGLTLNTLCLQYVDASFYQVHMQ
ncbi:hypothetical protein HDU76_007577 [Blyttiomyces sp. JEL0837]|nr:hypothetical protein HDU76_007577 [Blyttiomyces sp. JEL0837]